MGTSLRGIRESDIGALYELAAKDNHDLWIPTHVIESDGEMVGSISIDGIPLCTGFISSEINSPFALRAISQEVEEVVRNYGDKRFFMCIGPQSPAYRFMPRGGYSAFKTTLWYKEISE